jgi:chromosome segregation ATPase
MVSDTPEPMIGDVTPAGGVHFEVEIADVGLADQGHRSRVQKIRALRVTQQVEIREPPAARMYVLRKRISEDEFDLADTRERIAELENRAKEMQGALDELRAELAKMEKASL